VSSRRAPILLIDRNTRNLELLAEFLQKQGYNTLPLNDLSLFEHSIAGAEGVVLALVDISGFDRAIWDYCQILSDRNIPFIVISPRQVAEIRQEGRSHGAQDVLLKPLIAQELTLLIHNLIGDGH
jgi:DNA-binding response OmpR family regulator